MWCSGSTHSQRSSGATPRFQAEAMALAPWFDGVSTTGFGSPIVPDVNNTVSPSPAPTSPATARKAETSTSGNRGSTGTSTAPARAHA